MSDELNQQAFTLITAAETVPTDLTEQGVTLTPDAYALIVTLLDALSPRELRDVTITLAVMANLLIARLALETGNDPDETRQTIALQIARRRLG